MMNWSEHEPESFPKPRPIILPLIFWLSSISLLRLRLSWSSIRSLHHADAREN
jgi:hypothetical protein